MNDLIARIRVVATSAVTWMTAAVAVLTAVAVQLEDLAPEYVRYPAAAAAGLSALIAVIRVRTPAEPAERGLLAPEAD